MSPREKKLEEENRELRRLLDAVEVRNRNHEPRNIFICRTALHESYPPESSKSNTVYPIVIQDGSFNPTPGFQPGTFTDHSAEAKIFATALTDVYLDPETKGIAFEITGNWWFIPECRAEDLEENGDAAIGSTVMLRVEYSWENGCYLLIRLWDSFNFSFPAEFNNLYRVTVFNGVLDTDQVLAQWDGRPGEPGAPKGGVIISSDVHEGRILYYLGWPNQVLVRVEGWSNLGFYSKEDQILSVPTPTKAMPATGIFGQEFSEEFE